MEKKESEVAQSFSTLCDPIDCSLSRFSVHGIFQARILEWIAISFSRGSCQPRDRTRVSHIVSRCFTVWATREVQGSSLVKERILTVKAILTSLALRHWDLRELWRVQEQKRVLGVKNKTHYHLPSKSFTLGAAWITVSILGYTL